MNYLNYGITKFKRLRRDGLYYVDKTMYLPLLEKEGTYLAMLRPRRFGKSLFLSMMAAYYDVNMKSRFNELFGDLWIGQHPTPLANMYQVLCFDFSRADAELENLEKRFNEYCCNVLNRFIEDYKGDYDDITYNQVIAADNAESKLDIISLAAESLDHRLYLIIDEYDNFVNNILASPGHEAFEYITHAEGFYRRFFKLFKGPIERIFMMGISPIALDDLTSGYNIDWNISNSPEFNSMLGFDENEIRQIIDYHKEKGKFTGNIDAVIHDMKPLYDNYCFALKSYGLETVYNCDMALYYLIPLLNKGFGPEDLIDKNIKMDYSKLKMLVSLEKGKKQKENISSIEDIIEKGYVDMHLAKSFPAKQLLDQDNFLSLMYYFGMLSIGDGESGVYHMIIPNECVRKQYWEFMLKIYEETYSFKFDLNNVYYKDMFFNGIWKPVIEKIGSYYYSLSSVKDSIKGESNVSGFFKAILGSCDYSILCPELELNYGYGDFLMFPLINHYPKAKHCYIIEFKYTKTNASDKNVESKFKEAECQIQKYTSSDRFLRAISGCILHGIAIVFKGPKMLPPKVYLEKEIL